VEDTEYPRMFRLEDHHWWYLGMETITRAFLDRYLPASANRQILDAGCGTGGAMTHYLRDYGRVTGFDISPLALQLCQTRGLQRLARAEVLQIPFGRGSFDLVTCFDVIYMLERASPALEELGRVLRPGGHLLLRVAAYDWLRGQHDIAVKTVHRYTRPEVSRVLTQAGFDVLHTSYANTLLFPLVVIKRLFERIRPPTPGSSDLTEIPMGFGVLLRAILAAEARIAARGTLPFGLSISVLARKPVG
jgi:SAM-dependent methyltransferase